MEQPSISPLSERELIYERVINTPPEVLFRAWTEPEFLKQWFCPKPWSVSSAELDVRPGGCSLIMMVGPEGQEFPNRGIYLDVVKNERLVFTDAFVEPWVPSEKAFMVGTILFEAFGTKTKYKAVLRHWSMADREAHQKMGFPQGWDIATNQLIELIQRMGLAT